MLGKGDGADTRMGKNIDMPLEENLCLSHSAFKLSHVRSATLLDEIMHGHACRGPSVVHSSGAAATGAAGHLAPPEEQLLPPCGRPAA